jgi:LAO/AO transport system kinase
MTAPPQGHTVAAILAGDRRAIGRLITRAESGDPDIVADLATLYLAGGKARMVGITGPPGSGKSTLIDQLVAHLRERGKSVAVLAVDPTSPFSGGAVLGDRVRMSRHQNDSGVLIRSMAARGALGGLADATGDALTILDAAGFDVLLVETVGVGQSEVDILAHADLVVLLQTADGGDGVQSVKAGVLEIADILIVNKADLPGTERMVRALSEMVAHRAATEAGWQTPVLTAQATSNQGVAVLAAAIDSFYAGRMARPADNARRRKQVRARALAVAQAALRRKLAASQMDARLEAQIAAVADRRAAPSSVARMLLSGELD